jgi:hypothetical protein
MAQIFGQTAQLKLERFRIQVRVKFQHLRELVIESKPRSAINIPEYQRDTDSLTCFR